MYRPRIVPKDYIKTELDNLLETVDPNKEIQEQLDVLKQFDNISDEQIKELTYYIKSDEAGIVIEYLGFEKVKKYAPQFLEFLEDMNWPAAGYVANMLVAAEEKIIPEIKKVFKESSDYLWQYWIIIGILRRWEAELVSLLKTELLELIKKADKVISKFKADKEYASTEAFLVLKEKKLLSKEEELYYYNFLRDKFSNIDSMLKDLDQKF